MLVFEPFIKAPLFTKKHQLKKLLSDLGEFQSKFKIINVVGTNGKGSVSNYLANQLQLSYKKVGLFTSPAFLYHNERIKINQVSISDAELIRLLNYYQPMLDAYELNFFDSWLFLALKYYAEQNVDIIVLEAGIGGLHDSTNLICNQQAVLLTSVSYDHTEILGHSIESIISNKLGIAQPHTPVFIASSNKKYQSIINQFPLNIIWSEPDRELEDFNQQDNVGLVNCFLKTMKLTSDPEIYNQPPLLGRFTILQTNPYLILDGAHNPGGISNLLINLQYYNIINPLILFAASNKKDYQTMIKLLIASGHELYLTTFNNPKAWDLSKVNYFYKTWDWKKFIKDNRDRNIVVCGSLYFIPYIYYEFINNRLST